MPANSGPIEGNWYEIIETGECFFVVTVDEEEGVLEIQYEDGVTEELDLDAWDEMDLESIEAPEDYLGDLDELEELDEESFQREDSGEDWGEAMPEPEE
ncbi:DUF6763 family protein [Thiovibrio sp. JS02]